jgi:hypothetical protein
MKPIYQELFGTDVGLLSLAVIAVTLIIGVVLYVILRRKMREPPAG